MAPKRILIIAGGIWQIPVITTAKKMGLTVIVTDWGADAAARKYADFFEVADIKDKEKTLKVAQKYKIDAVLTEQTDLSVPTAAYVAEKLGLPGLSYHTALQATNKFLMRKVCQQAGIPMPRFARVHSLEEALEKAAIIGYPVIIKPADSQSSRGVAKIYSPDDLRKWVPLSFAQTRLDYILVEELMMGTESSLEGFVHDGALHVFGVCDKIKCKPPYSFDTRLMYPANFPEGTVAAMKKMNADIVRAIGIDCGITHTEMIITEDGPRLIEIAARGCGSRIASDLIPEMTGIDLTRLKIEQTLDPSKSLDLVPTKNLQGFLEFIILPEGHIKKLGNIEAARQLPGILALEFFVKEHEYVPHIDCGRKRPGYFLGICSSREEGFELSQRVYNTLDYIIE